MEDRFSTPSHTPRGGAPIWFSPLRLTPCGKQWKAGGKEWKAFGTDPLTLWTNWCWSRGSEPDPQGQSGGPEGPAAKARVLLTSKQRNCAYRQTRPGGPFWWSRGWQGGPQGRNLVHRVRLPQRCFRIRPLPRYTQEVAPGWRPRLSRDSSSMIK
jgi:hypothetical protein